MTFTKKIFIIMFLSSMFLSAQEVSRYREKLAETRREHWEQVAEENKKNLPDVDGKLPLFVREGIAKNRDITVEEFDSGVKRQPKLEKRVEQGLNIVAVLFFLTLVAFLVTLFKRHKVGAENENINQQRVR